MSALRAWLRAHRSAVVQEVLRRGLESDRPPVPWFMHSVRSTDEGWLKLMDFAERDAWQRRKAKEEAERPIREEAAAERTRAIVERLRATKTHDMGSIGPIAAAFIEREFGLVPPETAAAADDANACTSCHKPVEPGKGVRNFAGSVFHYGCFGNTVARAPGCPTGGFR